MANLASASLAAPQASDPSASPPVPPEQSLDESTQTPDPQSQPVSPFGQRETVQPSVMPISPFSATATGAPAASTVSPVSVGGVQGYQPGSPAAEQARRQAAAEAAKVATTPPPPTIGRSIGGLVGAAVIAFFFCLLWLIVELFAGGRMGVLAWGLGGLIGLVAGAIAKTPSKGFAAATAGLAVMAILIAKIVMAGGVMLAAKGMGMAENLFVHTPDAVLKQNLVADEMLANDELDGAREEYAKASTEAFFSGSPGSFYGKLSEDAMEAEEPFLRELRERAQQVSAEDRETLIAESRKRHPMWIEDQNHYYAVLDAIYNEPEDLDPRQKSFARAELSLINGDDYSDRYFQRVNSDEINQQRKEIRQRVATRLNQMDVTEIDTAIRETMKRSGTWNPFLDASVAMKAKMFADGEFASPLDQQVRADLAAQFNEEEADNQDYYGQTDWPTIDKRSTEINRLVIVRLVEFNQEQRDVLIADTLTKHPNWMRREISAEDRMERLSEEMGNFGDGTFLSSLGVVLGPLDFLWIGLAGCSAFGTVRKLGQG